jgi:hypothetical protein
MPRRMLHLAIVTNALGRKRISSNGWPPAAPLARTAAPSLQGSNPSSPPLNNRLPWFAPLVRAFGPDGVSQSIPSVGHLSPPGAFAGASEPAAGPVKLPTPFPCGVTG